MFATALLLALCAGAFAQDTYPYAKYDYKLPVREINLAAEPHLYRMRTNCLEYIHEKWTLVSSMNTAATALAILSRAGCKDTACYDRLAAMYKKNWPVEYDEAEGWLWCLNHNGGPQITKIYPLNQFVASLYMSEFMTLPAYTPPRSGVYNEAEGAVFGCTGIVACGKNGHVVHGRNLDLSSPSYTQTFANISSVLHWVDGKKFVADGIEWHVGLTGALTTSNGAFTVTMNSRMYSQGPKQNLSTMLACMETDSGQFGAPNTAPLGQFLRWTLENAKDYETALTVISQAKWCAPIYLVMSGPGPAQGAALAMGPPAAPTPVRTLTCEADNWYLIQTNWDSFEIDTANKDGRWLQAKEKLESMGQAAFDKYNAVDRMWEVMRMPQPTIETEGGKYCYPDAKGNTVCYRGLSHPNVTLFNSVFDTARVLRGESPIAKSSGKRWY